MWRPTYTCIYGICGTKNLVMAASANMYAHLCMYIGGCKSYHHHGVGVCSMYFYVDSYVRVEAYTYGTLYCDVRYCQYVCTFVYVHGQV